MYVYMYFRRIVQEMKEVTFKIIDKVISVRDTIVTLKNLRVQSGNTIITTLSMQETGEGEPLQNNLITETDTEDTETVSRFNTCL